MFADVNTEYALGEPMRCWREESEVSGLAWSTSS